MPVRFHDLPLFAFVTVALLFLRSLLVLAAFRTKFLLALLRSPCAISPPDAGLRSVSCGSVSMKKIKDPQRWRAEKGVKP